MIYLLKKYMFLLTRSALRLKKLFRKHFLSILIRSQHSFLWRRRGFRLQPKLIIERKQTLSSAIGLRRRRRLKSVDKLQFNWFHRHGNCRVVSRSTYAGCLATSAAASTTCCLPEYLNQTFISLQLVYCWRRIILELINI